MTYLHLLDPTPNIIIHLFYPLRRTIIPKQHRHYHQQRDCREVEDVSCTVKILGLYRCPDKMIWTMKHFVILFILRLQRHRILDFKVTWETSVGYATNG